MRPVRLGGQQARRLRRYLRRPGYPVGREGQPTTARVGQNCCAGVSARQVSGSRVSYQRHCRASAFSEEDTRLR